jgi:hypothetical protein
MPKNKAFFVAQRPSGVEDKHIVMAILYTIDGGFMIEHASAVLRDVAIKYEGMFQHFQSQQHILKIIEQLVNEELLTYSDGYYTPTKQLKGPRGREALKKFYSAQPDKLKIIGREIIMAAPLK